VNNVEILNSNVKIAGIKLLLPTAVSRNGEVWDLSEIGRLLIKVLFIFVKAWSWFIATS
jgi:hypothetical protein